MQADTTNAGVPGRADPSSLLRTFPLMLMYAVGFMSITHLPVWVGATAARFGVAVSQFGMIGSLELGALALASILSAVYIDASHLRWPIAAALLVGFAGNVVAALAPSVGPFMISRCIVGMANGFLLADINLRAARNAAAPRVFAGQIFVLVLVAVVFFSSAPHLIERFGFGSIFFFFAAVGLIALLSTSLLPKSPRSVKSNAARPTPSVDQAAALMLGGVTLVFVANNSVWAYLSPAADAAGLSLKTLSSLLACGALLNLAAPVISAWLAGRVRAAIALTMSIIAIAVCILMIAGLSQPILCAIGALLMPFFVMFSVPIYMGTMVRLDPSGRYVAASPAFLVSGAAIGQAIGGFAINRGGLNALAVTAVLLAALAFAATWGGLLPPKETAAN